MRDFFGSHWFATILLLAAVVISVGLALRKLRGIGWWLAAFGFGFFALGGIVFTALQFDTSLGRILVPQWLTYLGATILSALTVLLVSARRWSFNAASIAAALLMLGFGAFAETEIGSGLVEAWHSLRGLHFVQPWWLLLLLLVPVVVMIARRSLSGLGPTRKWLAICARCLIVASLAMALAEPRFGRPTQDVTVLFVIDRSLSVPPDYDPDKPATDQVDRRWLRIREFVENAINRKGPKHANDLAGAILFGKRPKLAAPPSPVVGWPLDPQMAGPIDGQYTDIAAALKLALASFPEGTGRRIVLISDGNENLGNAEEQAAIAKQNGVQIDTIALAPGYRNENEVLVQSVEAPRITAAGTRVPIRVLVRNASPNRVVIGRLELVRVGPGPDGTEAMELMPIDDANPDVIENGDGRKPPLVKLNPGLNSFRFFDKASGTKDSSYSYRSTFTPVESALPDGTARLPGLPGDRVANNRAGTVVVTRSQRKVLFIDGTRDGVSPHLFLIRTLLRSKFDVVLRSVDALETNVEDLTKFLADHDCIILANIPAEALSLDRQEAIRTCVHDQGCGLVMIGGPDAYGPGGYQGTPVEAALPVDCEIKALKAAGRGGLILIMHACEMADGNKWEKEIAKLALQRLNPNDMVGVMQYGFSGGASGVSWVIPFSEIGDRKNKMLAAIDTMIPGDMPNFDPFLKDAVDNLTKPEYGLAVKHIMLISDGDPLYGPVGRSAIKKAAENNVTCTTIGVATHSPAEGSKLKTIAEGTRDGKGNPGTYYEPKNPNQLPAIYIKEARRISQSFIYDKPFVPVLRLQGGPTEGLDRLPPLDGFVRTTLKESPLVEMRIEGPRVMDQQFPILATWQYGLGKAVAFTSDARTQPNSKIRGWDKDWVVSEVYQKFWEQTVTWAMRAAEKGKMTLTSDYRDGRVRITIDARDDKDRPVGGLDLKGGISLPRPLQPGEKPPVITFKKKGSGLYEAEFASEEAGSYFVTIQGYQAGPGGAKNLFDYARTGVTVPYSQEFADLESNTPLLKRLSEMTGGKYHTDDPKELEDIVKSNEVFREAPKGVRAIKPFWYWLVFAAGLLFLFDVGVRRVSLEWPEVVAGAQGFWRSLREKSDGEVVSTGLERLKQRKQAVGEKLEAERAARKFDPGTAPGTPAPKGADELVRGSTSSLPPAPSLREEKPKEEEDMFSALKKAKKRADHNK